MRKLFFTKCDRGVLQNASDVLLQNAPVIAKCDVHCTYQSRKDFLKYLKGNKSVAVIRNRLIG